MFLNRHPFSVILCSTAIVGLFSIPYMLNFQVEDNVFELWLPQDQEYYKNGKWIEKTFRVMKRLSTSCLKQKINLLQQPLI